MYLLGVLIERTTQSLNRPFYYSYSGEKNVGVGYRVVVNFASSLLVGYVISCEVENKTSQELEEDLGFSIKEINDILDEEPLLSDELVKLSDEMSSYYLASKISILQTM